ncbi:MAG TPA: ABC transporter ATP-binding protein, partial [Gemmatimonadaceae bacterium]|nr:ABC transporter ATP-binding protein [Gemmatimonadaceae bacterium]
MSSDALNIGGIDIVFGSRTAIQSIDLDVAREERFVILGPSGAGKTTLLRAIAGFLAPARGTIHIDGRDVTALPPERRNAVYMHQSPVLFPHLDVFENVAFALRLRHLPWREILGRVTDALGVTGLTGYERRMPRALSGGERHRVALARAVVARPALLLLDEPLSALDPALRSDVRSALLATHRKYQTAY